MNDHDTELPMLAGIGAFIRWCEELASLLAGPVLTFGLGVALIDLFTDGRLLAASPVLLFAWAASQTVGLDAQLVGSAAKLGAAIRRRAVLPIMGYTLLVIALGYVAFQASNVFATQQAEGIPTAVALARLGMNAANWIIERSALAVLLVILSGLLRYVAPAKVAASAADERAALERQLELEPLRQRLRAQQVGGLRSLAETALRGAGSVQNASPSPEHFEASQDSQSPHTATQEGQQHALPDEAERLPIPTQPQRPPTGPGSPSVASKPATRQAAAAANVTPLHAPRPARQSRRVAARANARGGKRGTAEKRIRALLTAEPALPFDQLVKRAKVSESTASKWLAVIAAEQNAQQNAEQNAQPQRQDGVQYAQ